MQVQDGMKKRSIVNDCRVVLQVTRQLLPSWPARIEIRPEPKSAGNVREHHASAKPCGSADINVSRDAYGCMPGRSAHQHHHRKETAEPAIAPGHVCRKTNMARAIATVKVQLSSPLTTSEQLVCCDSRDCTPSKPVQGASPLLRHKIAPEIVHIPVQHVSVIYARLPLARTRESSCQHLGEARWRRGCHLTIWQGLAKARRWAGNC